MTVTDKNGHTFSYKFSWKNILVLFVIGLTLGLFMVHAAQTNAEKLVVNGVIELSVNQATVFFWAMSAFMFGLVFLSIMGLIQRIKGTNRIVLTSNGLWLPGPIWSGGEKFHEFSSIKSMKIVSVYKSTVLQAKTRDSKFAIASQNFSSSDEFEKVVAMIQQGVNASDPKSPDPASSPHGA